MGSEQETHRRDPAFDLDRLLLHSHGLTSACDKCTDTWHSWNGIPVSPNATTPLQAALACSPTPSTPRWSIFWFIFFLCPFFFPHAYPLTLEICNLKAFSKPQTIALMRIRPFSGEAPALPEGIWAVPVASALVSSNPNWIVHLFLQQNSKGRFKTELTLNKCN